MWILDALKGLIGNRPVTVTIPLGSGYTTVHNLFLKRTKLSADGIFGVWTCDYASFTCVTVENLDHEMKPGRYRVMFDKSPRLGYVTPHIADPERDTAAGGDAGLRVHEANRPDQLDGCIALGRVKDGDAVDNSDSAFTEFMMLTDKNIETWLTITEEYGA